MKRLPFILVLFFALLSGCERNFDEWVDTSQRSLTLVFNVPGFKMERLERMADGEFVLKDEFAVQDGQAVRISAYFYDETDSLVQKHTVLSDGTSPARIEARHLQKDARYLVLCVADVVTQDPFVDYYETWYQMAYRSSRSFYLTSSERSGEGTTDIVLMDTLNVVPSNQELEVLLKQHTYNAFFVFTNTGKTDKLEGRIATYMNIYARNDLNTNRYYYMNRFEETALGGVQYIKPATFNSLDNNPYVFFKINTMGKQDSTKISLTNSQLRPMVVTLDCSTLKKINTKKY